jgi:hypothetical protein
MWFLFLEILLLKKIYYIDTIDTIIAVDEYKWRTQKI